MTPPTDAALLLHVHAEHEWLQDELESLLDQLERPADLRLGEMQAALAYLEVTWLEAERRAARTDAACQRLTRRAQDGPGGELGLQAGSYYRWLLTLRESLAARVEPFAGGATGPLQISL